MRGARALRGPVGNSIRSCVLLGTRVCDQLAEPIHGAEHLIKILHGALKLARVIFAVKDLIDCSMAKIWSSSCEIV